MDTIFPCLAAILLCVTLANAKIDYCFKNTYNTNNTWMQFSKEVADKEYGLEGKFKSLHCCAKGYRTIEWFKDGKPYPWRLSESKLIVYPEARNQTLYTRSLFRSDKGLYSCLLKNETHQEVHTISLEVFETPQSSPRTTFVPSDQWVVPGAEVRLYCEAFVGGVNLEDGPRDIIWRRFRPSDDQQIEFGVNQQQIRIERENEDIVGALLQIDNVGSEDYGKYVCTVRNNDFRKDMPVILHYFKETPQPDSLSSTQVILGVILLAVTVAALYTLWWRCRGPAVLQIRSLVAFRTQAQPDTRPDALIACTMLDEPLVRSAMAPTLEQKYHYKLERITLPDDPSDWYSLLIGRTYHVRSLVVVLSPRQYTVSQLHEAVKQVRALPLPPVIVLLQDLPKLKLLQKDATGETLISLLRKTRVIPWKHLRDRQFWTNLRLALPLPSPQYVPNDFDQTDQKREAILKEEDAIV